MTLTLSPTWTVPVILPGPGNPLEQTSTSAPALGVFSTNGNVYLAFRQTGSDAIWVNFSSDGQSWTGTNSYAVQRSITVMGEDCEPETPNADVRAFTLFRPSLANYNSAMYMAYTNKQSTSSSVALLRSTNPNSSPWRILPSVPSSSSISGPSIAPYTNGRLYLAYTDSSNRVMVGNYNATSNSYSTFAAVKDSGGNDYKTTDGPCLWSVTSGSLNYRLYICFRAANIVYIGYANIDTNGDITSWTPQTTAISSPFSIIETPSISVYGSDFFMTVSGPKDEVRYGSSSTEGVSWSGWGEVENSTNGPPATIQKGSILVMALTNPSINTAKTYVLTAYATFPSS